MRHLGALVHDYVCEQCDVLRDARAAIAEHEESAVHPARVAIRRLRATLRTFGAVYDRGERAALADELRWAGNLLGDVRDLQVLAERFAGEDSPASAAARQVIGVRIERDRRLAWSAVTAGLGSARGAALFDALSRWRGAPPFTAEAERPAEHAREGVAEADAKLRERLAAAAQTSDAEPDHIGAALHDARKAAKRHRYAVELALPVLGDDGEELLERRRALQDALGAHQDAVVALAFLQRIDLDDLSRQSALALQDVIGYTRAGASDVQGVLSRTEQLRG